MPEPPIISTHHTARRWLPSEVATLRDLDKAGYSVADIAAQMGRSRCSVYSQLDRMGLLCQKKPRKEPKPKVYKPPKPVVLIEAPSFLAAVEAARSHNMTNWDWEPTGEPEPVAFRGGTLGKVEAMAARIEKGLPLWADGDGVEKAND